MKLRPQRHRIPTAGFSLLEMLVVLSVIALASSAAVVMVRPPSSGLQLQAASRKLCAALTLARAQAIAGNTEKTIEFDLKRGTYSVDTRAAEAFPSGVVATVTFAESERERASVGRIRFFPSGAATGADVMLVLGERRTAISVNWLTGVARCES